ncbi:hypothetical protein [Adhaeribacter aquaticus]|uniref:hypothetical protein n=1 Tax=Adhaeribacter aquaticus TaxID=299567 RepID=UPI00047C2D50|nr:hypothetical protein [Adhaeribacter aquaticus]
MSNSIIKFNVHSCKYETIVGDNDDSLKLIEGKLSKVEPQQLYNMLRVLNDQKELYLLREDNGIMEYVVL